MDKKKGKVFKFSSEEVAGFCEQIAILLNGGISLYEGIYMLSAEIENHETKSVLEQLEATLKGNKPFWESLDESGAFPSYMVNMVRIGEMTGKLETVMYSLNQYYERESNLKSSIKNVISYPITMFAMIAVILMVLIFKILPMFQNVFEELTTGSNYSGNDMMHLGLLAGKVITVVLAVVSLVVLAFWIWYKSREGRKKIFHFLSGFLLTRNIMELMAVGKFVSSMFLMISSGMNTKESFEMAKAVVDHKAVKEKIHKCLEMLEKEVPMEKALKETKLITGMQGRMISVGAKTGVMDAVFEKLSKQYDNEIENELAGLAGGVETVLVVALSVIVGAILISVMMPLISIISTIG